MPGVSTTYPIKNVELFDVGPDETRLGVELPVSTTVTTDFPAQTLVSVDASGNVQVYDEAVGNVALAYESSNDHGMNVKAGPQIFAGRKDKVYVIPVGGKRLVMTAGSSLGTTTLTSAHIGQSFDIKLDADGRAYVDLDAPYDATNNPVAPAKIVDFFYEPGGPGKFSAELNQRVIVEIDSAHVYTP